MRTHGHRTLHGNSRRRRFGVAATGALLLAGAIGMPRTITASAAAPGSVSSHTPLPVNPGTGLRPGVTPKVSGIRRAAATAHLDYYGGHVIPNVHVIQVLYGAGTYTSEVKNTAAPSIASFYGGVTNSPYFDWLSEYNTTINDVNNQPGTQQTIGRGSFSQQIQITPSPANSGSTVDDTNIQAELKAQVSAGHLPAPNANTYFALYFPANVTITEGGASSGVQFCAYHGTTSSPEIYYGVMPDFTTGGMTFGCGSGTTFQNETSVSSHELVEATTDAEVGLATTFAPPLSWYDQSNGEIGDICNGQQQAITGGDGRTYTVQQQWSNLQGGCVVSGPTATNDFSIGVGPSSLSVAAGSGGSATVSTAVISGSAGTVSLTASGQPAGVTVSPIPASVTAGGSSTLTISTTAATAPGTYPITIHGTEGSASHSTTLSLTVTPTGGVVNGGFETGTLSGWKTSGPTGIVSSGAQAGTFAARVGATVPGAGSTISQTFTVPGGTTGVSFYYNVFCNDTLSHDYANATLTDNTTTVTTTVLAKTCVNPSSGWKQVTAPVTAGHSVTLSLRNHDDNVSGNPTYTLYDSVTLGSGSVTTGVINGGFETGALDGWKTSGSTGIVSSGAQAGTFAAQVGSTSPGTGSTLSQTFTVPAGVTGLSFYYDVFCVDTVSHDYANATLTDNTTSVTTTVLAKTCVDPSSGWQHVAAAVTAGDSVTLSLRNHDDNLAGNPTYTLYDSVTLTP